MTKFQKKLNKAIKKLAKKGSVIDVTFKSGYEFKIYHYPAEKLSFNVVYYEGTPEEEEEKYKNKKQVVQNFDIDAKKKDFTITVY